MDGFASILKTNPELASTYRVAAMVGADMLRSEFEAAGLPDVQIDALLRDMVILSELLPTPESAITLGTLLDEAIERVAEKDEAFAATVDQAAEIEEGGRQMEGVVGEAAEFLRAAVYGVALLLLIAKMEGRFDWKSGDLYIGIEHGIPKDFIAVATTIRQMVRDVTGRGVDDGANTKQGDSP